MANPEGESAGGSLRVAFDRRLKLDFHGAKVVSHARTVTFQLAEVAVPRHLFADILRRIDRLRGPPAAPI